MSSLLPELKEVVHALDPIADKYFEVGVQLGLKPELIRRIEGEHTSHTRRFCETIHSWQRNNSSERCTWSTLAEAVARVGGHDNLVRELEKRGNNAPVSRQSCGESEDSAKDTGYSTKSDWTTSSGSETATEKSFTVAKIEGLDGGDQRGNNTPPLPSESGAEDTGYSTKSDSPISYTESSSGSETERFELVPGCGCKEKPCSVYTLCARGCPKPTRRRIPVLQKKRVGVVSQDDLPFEDEDDCEDFERETKKIQKYFGKFIKDTCCSFKERNVDIEMLTLYLQSSFPVMKPRSKELDEATSMEQVFKIVVDQACSWFNYEVIVSIIEVFGVSSDKDRAQMYEEEFKKYAEQRLPKGKKHIEIGSGAKVGTKQLVVKIDKEWDKVNSNELDKLRGSFASILGVHRSDLYLADVREGCIMMTFMIQEELAKKLFPKKSCLTAEQIHLLKSESVISVRCGNLSWRASAMASNKTESTAVPMEPQTRGASTTANDISDAVTDIEALTPFPLVADEMHPPILYRTPSGGAPSRSQTLGHGSYGVVYKAKCDQLRCAAKVLHPTIVDPSNHDPGVVRIIDGFSQECALLESIRHPNIVKLREPPSSPHNIIHRDLSSNNVLIIAGRRAKVTDFGMSKLAGAAPTMTPLTMYPGTLAYMPPEALREPPRYTKKLDCFSEGVIMIQVCTRLWPVPGPRTQLVPDSRSPTGSTEMPVLEPERRKNHIDRISPTHTLLPIAIDCLKFQESKRPSSEELCQRLAGLKNSRRYRDNVRQHSQDEIQAKDIQIMSQNQQLLEKDRVIQDKERMIQIQDKVIQEKERELHDNDRVIQDKDIALQGKERESQEKERALQDKDREIASRERQLRQLNQELEEQERDTSEIQQTNHSLQRQVEELQEQLSQQLQRSQDHKPHPIKECNLILKWKVRGKAPCEMYRGAAVVDGCVAYFINCNGQACSYNSTNKKWSELPIYSYKGSSLAAVNGQLTAIGGCEDDMFQEQICTNKLLSLHSGSWSDVFPPMPTKRHSTTAISSNEHLIVAGGSTGLGLTTTINTVEVMDTKTLVWSTVASLPHPYNWASATICGDHLYMLGGWYDKGKTKSVLTCSLTELLQSSSSSSSVWHRVADVPTYYSTCVAVNGQLLAVGGCDISGKSTAAVHKYSPTTNSWDHISNMLVARCAGLVVVLPTNKMMAVGGKILFHSYTRKVEIAKI